MAAAVIHAFLQAHGLEIIVQVSQPKSQSQIGTGGSVSRYLYISISISLSLYISISLYLYISTSLPLYLYISISIALYLYTSMPLLSQSVLSGVSESSYILLSQPTVALTSHITQHNTNIHLFFNLPKSLNPFLPSASSGPYIGPLPPFLPSGRTSNGSIQILGARTRTPR